MKFNKRAFTLVEIMVAVILTALVLSSGYYIWSTVQHRIARAQTRQILQTELRGIANYMQNDFKSIKYDENTFKLTNSGNGDNFTLSFDKFRKEKEDELAQEATEKVVYEKKGSMLTRTLNTKKVLSVHCETVDINRSEEGNNGASVSLEQFNDDYAAGRKAKLDISITGKMNVPGSSEVMYLVENTSVVMRDEYYKNTNKSYLSTFDLLEKETEEVIASGDAKPFGNGSLDEDYLLTLDDDTLDGMEKTQNDYKKQTLEQLDNLNKEIKETNTGGSKLKQFGDFLAFWNESEEETVKKNIKELAGAKTKKECENVKDKLNKFTGEKNDDFIDRSTGNKYKNMTAEDKEIYKIAYGLKCQDRNIDIADKASKEKAEKENTEFTATPKSIDTYMGGNQESKKTSDDNEKSANEDKKDKVLKAYKEINLDWMDNKSDKKEQELYAAAESLVTYADSKIEILNLLDTYDENIKNIQKAKANN